MLRRLSPLSRYMSTSHVILKRLQSSRVFLLNRPEKLNSLSLDMINIMSPQLEAWTESDQCNVILLMTACEKAFCAGGDVVNVTSSTPSKALQFFESEYKLNHRIGTLGKPFVSIMDGVTMGGGVGLSVHAPFRIATERTVFAMPETHIGLFPDVGGSFFLSRMDGFLGTYLGLTGARVIGHHVFMAGIATHYVPQVRIEALVQRLSELDSPNMELVNDAIEEFSADPIPVREWQTWPLGGDTREVIDRCFKHNSISEIFEALDAEGTDWARETLVKLRKASPTSLVLTLLQLRKGAKKSFSECFKMEYRMVQQCLKGPDFKEGVKALLVEKRAPKWNPASITDISIAKIESDYFPQKAELELTLTTDVTYYQYPHHTLSSLPTSSDVKRVVEGNGQRGLSYNMQSISDLVDFFMREWGRFDHDVIGKLNLERDLMIRGGRGKGKVGLGERVMEICMRWVGEKDGRVHWKGEKDS